MIMMIIYGIMEAMALEGWQHSEPNVSFADNMSMTKAGKYIIINARLFLFISPCFILWLLLY
jgi:hypothetical protein